MSTNYFNTLITLAPDSPTDVSSVPNSPRAGVAMQQYQMVAAAPYTYTSDDVIFARIAEKESIAPDDMPAAREAYFQKGRACLRTSPLPKQFGWGIHADADGRIALIPAESARYAELLADDAVKKLPAMRRSR